MKFETNFVVASSFNKAGFAHGGVSFDEAYIVDTLGNKHKYLGMSPYNLPSEEIYQKEVNGKWGFYDLKSKTSIIPHEYDLVYHFNNGLAPVRKGRKWGYINRKNELIIDFNFDDASSFSEGLAAI